MESAVRPRTLRTLKQQRFDLNVIFCKLPVTYETFDIIDRDHRGRVCCSCTSPSAPSEVQTLYELRLAESPICPTLTAGTPSAQYGFFKFGTG